MGMDLDNLVYKLLHQTRFSDGFLVPTLIWYREYFFKKKKSRIKFRGIFTIV